MASHLSSDNVSGDDASQIIVDQFGHTSTLHVAPSAEEASTVADIRARLSSGSSRADQLVRRDFESKLSSDPRVSIMPGAGQATSQTLGPFIDSSGRSVAIDVIKPLAEPLVEIQRVGAPEPFLYFPASSLSGIVSTIALSAGSIWCPAPQFSKNSPSSSFMGL
jgi:hypothetical protein